MAHVVKVPRLTLKLLQNTYLIQAQASSVAELHLLVFGRVRRLSVRRKPILEQVGRLLGEVSPSLPVEGVVVEANIVLEANVAIGRIVAGISRPGVEGILWPIIAAVRRGLVVVVIALLAHGGLVGALSNGRVCGGLRKGNVALGSRRRLMANMRMHRGCLLVRWWVRRTWAVRVDGWYRGCGMLVTRKGWVNGAHAARLSKRLVNATTGVNVTKRIYTPALAVGPCNLVKVGRCVRGAVCRAIAALRCPWRCGRAGGVKKLPTSDVAQFWA